MGHDCGPADAEAEAAFHRLDIDGDGDIDKDDLRGMLAGMDEGAIDRLIAQAEGTSADRDGKLNLAEFKAAIAIAT